MRRPKRFGIVRKVERLKATLLKAPASGGYSEWILVQRSKKPRTSAKRPTAFSGTANRREAITRRSLVQVLPPQPQRRKLHIACGAFFMLAHLKSPLHSFRCFAVAPQTQAFAGPHTVPRRPFWGISLCSLLKRSHYFPFFSYF